MMGLLIFKAVDEALCTALNAYPVGKLLGYGPLRQYRELAPAALSSVLMGAAVYRMEGIALRAPLLLLAQLAAGVLLYGGFSLVFQRDTLRELWDFIRTRREKA